MTNTEQDLLEAYQILCLHLRLTDMGPMADKAEFSAQLRRLQTAADRFLALPRPAQTQKAA